MNSRTLIFASTLCFSALVLAAATPASATILESLDGASSLTVVAPDGTTREIKAGDLLQTGDILATSAHVALTIAFEQGAQVMVSTDSKVQVSEETEEPGEPHVPAVVIREGDIRALVEPSRAATQSHHFLIRTTSAVMGVRGTDFFVSGKDGQFSLNTVSGTVEYADDLKGFKSASMVSVSAGQYYTPSGAKPFGIEEFLKTYHVKHPQMEKLYNQAKQDASDGSLALKLGKGHAKAAAPLKGDAPNEISFSGKKKTPPSPTPAAARH